MYKDLYRIKDLFGGFQIQNLKKNENIFNPNEQKGNLLSLHSVSCLRARKKK